MTKSSGILPAAITNCLKVQHTELPRGFGGATRYQDGRVVAIETPADPLVRVHELMHAQHSDPRGLRAGRHPMVQQLVEDMRLHANHWPWRMGATPAVIAKPGLKQLAGENKNIAKGMASPDCDMEGRGIGFCGAMRNAIAARAINGRAPICAPWFNDGERQLAAEVYTAIRCNDAHRAAALIERVYFPNYGKGQPGESGDGDVEGERNSDRDRNVLHRPKVYMRDQGPFTESCGDPMEDWTLAKTGTRLHVPSLCKPVPPSRLFLRREACVPGGTTLIDASGSMRLNTADMLAIINAAPHATLAIYSGGSSSGSIYVLAREGLRLSQEDITKILESKKSGNTIDLEATEWLLKQDAPRVFVTDRQFCGSNNTAIALAKFDNAVASGDIEWVQDGHDLIPRD